MGFVDLRGCFEFFRKIGLGGVNVNIYRIREGIRRFEGNRVILLYRFWV